MPNFGTSAMIVNSTISNWLKGATPAVLKKRYLMAKLMMLKRIKLGLTGNEINWGIRYKRSPMQTIGPGGTIVFGKESKNKKAKLPLRAMFVQGSIDYFDKQMNSGPEAKIDLWSQRIEERLDDMKDQFPEKIYQQDGYASGSGEIMGLPSAMGATADTNSIFATNGDTYANILTTRGTYGGSNSGDFWPFGTAPSQFGFHSPPIVNYTSPLAAASGGFESDVKTWANTGPQALRAGIMAARCNGGDLDVNILTPQMYRQFCDNVAADQRLNVNRNEDPAMTKLGFKGLNFDGVDLTYEVGLPAGIGYGLTFDDIELLAFQKKLFEPMTDFNLDSLSDRVALIFFGNLKLRKLNGTVQYRNVS